MTHRQAILGEQVFSKGLSSLTTPIDSQNLCTMGCGFCKPKWRGQMLPKKLGKQGGQLRQPPSLRPNMQQKTPSGFTAYLRRGAKLLSNPPALKKVSGSSGEETQWQQ